MENLTIEHKGRSIANFVSGSIFILAGIAFLIFDKDPVEGADWNRSIFIFIFGILILIQPFWGINRSKIEISDGCLVIRLVGWINTVRVKESEIERIILGKGGIKLYRTGKKPVSIYLYSLGREQKEQVYRFFTDYAYQNNFTS